MKKMRKGHTVSFVIEEKTLYGEIENIEVKEDMLFYTIYASNRLYKNVEERYILHDYGVIDE